MASGQIQAQASALTGNSTLDFKPTIKMWLKWRLSALILGFYQKYQSNYLGFAAIFIHFKKLKSNWTIGGQAVSRSG